jgi:predicted nucleic acid-binding protein
VIVTDASFLVLALGDDGAGGAEARARLRGEELVAPHLVDVEVASALRRAALTGSTSQQRARQVLQDLEDLPIERIAHCTVLPRVWELRDNYTANDACYVAVAELFHTPLVTCDAKMAGGTGARCQFEVFPN